MTGTDPIQAQSPRYILLFTTIASALLGMIGLVALEMIHHHDEEMSRAKTEATSLALTIEEYTIATFGEMDLMIQGVMPLLEERKNQRRLDAKELYDVLRHLNGQVAESELLGVTDENGFYIGNSLRPPPIQKPGLPPNGVSDRPYFLKHREDPKAGLIISEPVIGKTTGHLNVVLSRRISDAHGKFKGVVLASLNLNAISKFFENVGKGSEASISLWRTNRVLLARYPFTDDMIGKYYAPSPELKTLLDRGVTLGTYNTRSEVDGVYRIYAYKTLNNWPLTVYVGNSEKQVLKNWRRTFFITASLTLFLVVFVGLGLWNYIGSLREYENQRIAFMQSSKMSALGEMAAGMAHEINNPLAIIAGLSSRISSQLKSGSPDFQVVQTMAEKIEKTVQRIAKIIKGLRSFARESSGDPLLPTSLDLVLDNTLALTSERFKSHGVELRVVAGPRVEVPCREAQICQVLVNLLNNAFDAVTDPKGAPTEKWVDLEVSIPNPGRVRISVTDSGKGIPPEIRDRIMQPFFTTKGVHKGTGLGLSISKGIIEGHNGTFQLDAQNPHTRFVVELPTILERGDVTQA